MTKAEITICAYYGDLCVRNFSSGVSSWRSVIGRLRGPQREMTERALEERDAAAPPARPTEGASGTLLGGGRSTFKLFINLISLLEC